MDRPEFLDDIRVRYTLFVPAWIFILTIIVIPPLIPIMDMLPSVGAYLFFAFIFSLSLGIALYFIAEENAFAGASILSILSFTTLAGVDNIWPSYSWALYGTQPMINGQNAAIDTMIGSIVLFFYPNAATDWFINFGLWHLSMLWFLVYFLGTLILVIPAAFILGKRDLFDLVQEAFAPE